MTERRVNMSRLSPCSITSGVLTAVLAGNLLAASAVKVSFVLNTTDENGAPVAENRYYYVYRPDGLSTNTPVPMILVMEASPGSGAASFLNAKAAQAGFVVVSCSFSGNSTGTPGTVWNNDNPRITGYEDFDYTDEVIRRVQASDNCDDAFITGISKGGHMSLAYACERHGKIRAAGPMDEFMGLTSNIPQAPVPMIVFQGTLDTNVPYVMVKDTVDAWRMSDGLMRAAPVTTYEASPLIPGRVTQATWRGGLNGTQVAFVTIIGGTHAVPTPSVQTGYNVAEGLWTFFSQYLTGREATPRFVSNPVNNVQAAGQPASFWAVATGDGPLAYQWQKNGANISGATSMWYTTPVTSLADSNATFRAIVFNGAGSATSAVATLAVSPATLSAPVVDAQPTNAEVLAGQPVAFAVSAGGTGPFFYQWQKNGMDIAGATSPTCALAAALMPDCGAGFRAKISNAAGSVTSVRATLTVGPRLGAPFLLADPVRARVLTNQPAQFAVSAWSALPAHYQWQKGTVTGNSYDIPGATSSAYTVPSPTLADHLAIYRCTVSNALGSTTSASEFLMVTSAVKAPTDIISLTAAGAQVGVPFRYTIRSSGGTVPITYDARPLPDGLAVDAATGVISGTPTAAGTTHATLTASNSAGNTTAFLVLSVTETPPAEPAESWLRTRFGASAANAAVAGLAADPDADGADNLLEYATGTDPLAAGAAPLDLSFADGHLTLSATKNPHATNLTWTGESGPDLASWSATNATVLQNSGNLFQVGDNAMRTAAPRRFLRLRITHFDGLNQD